MSALGRRSGLRRDSPPNAFKSDGERIHALIQSLDSAQNGELWLPIGTLLAV
jgi:hypothetical protein